MIALNFNPTHSNANGLDFIIYMQSVNLRRTE